MKETVIPCSGNVQTCVCDDCMSLGYSDGRTKYAPQEYQAMRQAKIRQIQSERQKAQSSRADPSDLTAAKSKEALIKIAFSVNREFGFLDNQQLTCVLKELGRGVLLIQSF